MTGEDVAYRKFKYPFRAVWRGGGGRASAGLGAESDVRALGFGFSGPLFGAVRGYFLPILGSMPSAALRDLRRIRSGVRFALGVVAGRR